MPSLRDFIRQYRSESDEHIRAALRDPKRRLNDEERRQWILNDEGLYSWARSNRVKI